MKGQGLKPAKFGESPRSAGLLPKAMRTVVIYGLLATCAQAQVTFERLLNSGKEPQNWLTYSGDYSGRRFSSLDQVNATNARSLVAKWVYQTGATGKLETTPLVADGILYATAQDDRAFALDARTGRPIWMYQYAVPADIRPCCGHVNRGLAILGDKVFLGTLDAHVIALDAKTGNVVWNVTAADYRTGYSFTVAPLAVKNLVVIGVSGGEYGIRGFIDAYDATTGERKWRFYTVPGPGEPGHETWEGDSWKIGGAPAWNTGTYDAATNQIFWPTGNPSPSNRGEGRAGDNLYSNTLLALDADTGKMKWHFQFTKHDEHDWDATQVPVMIDAGGRHLIAQANRNGFFYVIDRTTGKLISANAYGKITWSDTKDAEGRPVAKKEASPTLEGHTVCPGALGTTNFMAPTYDQQTSLFYVTARDQCDIFSTAPQPYEAGHAYYGSAYFPSEEAEPYRGFLKAIDPATGTIKWKFEHTSPTWSGVLSTAGGLVFTGDAEGNFIALDAATGKALWHFQMGGAVYAAPMAFAVDGKQYVAIPAGSALYAFGLP
jgi:alcohol dehydrogenase (cytochrome c)